MDRPISFDAVASEFDKTRRLPEAVEGKVVDALAELVGTDRLLDAGVGTGRWAAPLVAKGVPVVGVDVAPKMLAVAASRGANDLLLGDVRRLPLRDRSVETAMSTHLLHLVRDWPRVLAEFGRVARSRYVSVLEFETEEPDLRDEYGELLRAHGIGIEAPGLSERDLRRRLPPEREVPVTTSDRRLPVREVLGPIASRRFRYTWDVPEDRHREAVAALQDRHDGGTVRNHLEVVLAAWSTDRLRDFATAEIPR